MKNFKHKTSKDGIHKLKKQINKLGTIILKINNDTAKIGFVDNFEEKDVFIKDLYDC